MFDNVEIAAPMTGGGPEARKLAAQMSGTLIAFGRSGDPNNPAIPNWPRYNLETRPTMVWDRTSRVENDPRREERKLMSTAPYVQPGT
jgi:para-nitrobenzyl esterase